MIPDEFDEHQDFSIVEDPSLPFSEQNLSVTSEAFVDSTYDPLDPDRTGAHRNQVQLSNPLLHQLSTPSPTVQYDTVNPPFVEPRAPHIDPRVVLQDFADDRIVSNHVYIFGPPQVVSEFQERQDQGFVLQETESTNLLCGIYALRISLRGLQHVGAPVPSPTPDELVNVLQTPDYDRLCGLLLNSRPWQDDALEAELESNNYLSAYQLSLILHLVGIKHHVSLRLGVCVMAEPKPGFGDRYNVFFVDLPWSRPGPVWTVWVINDNARAMSQDGDKILNHWSGFAPNSVLPSPSPALQAPASEKVPPVDHSHWTRSRRSRTSNAPFHSRSRGHDADQSGSTADGSVVNHTNLSAATAIASPNHKGPRRTISRTSNTSKLHAKRTSYRSSTVLIHSNTIDRTEMKSSTSSDLFCHHPNCKRKTPFNTQGALK